MDTEERSVEYEHEGVRKQIRFKPFVLRGRLSGFVKPQRNLLFVLQGDKRRWLTNRQWLLRRDVLPVPLVRRAKERATDSTGIADANAVGVIAKAARLAKPIEPLCCVEFYNYADGSLSDEYVVVCTRFPHCLFLLAMDYYGYLVRNGFECRSNLKPSDKSGWADTKSAEPLLICREGRPVGVLLQGTVQPWEAVALSQEVDIPPRAWKQVPLWSEQLVQGASA